MITVLIEAGGVLARAARGKVPREEAKARGAREDLVVTVGIEEGDDLGRPIGTNAGVMMVIVVAVAVERTCATLFATLFTDVGMQSRW